MDQKYSIFINVLDSICKEAPPALSIYHYDAVDLQATQQARSRAYIHLFLKVNFGILEFKDREKLVTDKVGDGGIDGYYIDHDNRTTYFIQSKFRTTDDNFTARDITLRELLKMDITRILAGNDSNENGQNYSGKIISMRNQIAKIVNFAEWKIVIIVLANVKTLSNTELERVLGIELKDNCSAEVFNHARCYNELLFPLIRGEYHEAKSLILQLDLSGLSLNSARIKYPVKGIAVDCHITVLFVPTEEIAESFNKYKNALLRHNPRSFLDLRDNEYNRKIANTITNEKGNTFALFNNGITIVADGAEYRDLTGRINRGQLIIKNPQIINGGQTAYTLSVLYEKVKNNEYDKKIFKNKDVMLKVMTFVDGVESGEDAIDLITNISKATNEQTHVTEADRRSNSAILIDLQQYYFEEHGYVFDRKEGEFYDAKEKGYINKKMIIERELLLRIAVAIDGLPDAAIREGGPVLFKEDKYFNSFNKDKEKIFSLYLVNNYLDSVNEKYRRDKDNPSGIKNYGHELTYGRYAFMYQYSKDQEERNTANNLETKANALLKKWKKFEVAITKKAENKRHFREIYDPRTKVPVMVFRYNGYYKNRSVKKQLDEYFGVSR